MTLLEDIQKENELLRAEVWYLEDSVYRNAWNDCIEACINVLQNDLRSHQTLKFEMMRRVRELKRKNGNEGIVLNGIMRLIGEWICRGANATSLPVIRGALLESCVHEFERPLRKDEEE